ncbi:MAG: pseudouridine-5'-phosphate glycosidase [Spirochaetaceae bacterium]
MALPIAYSTEVTRARRAGAALVALESTIISHGMPYPQNIETAREVEEAVRRTGAVPATIAIIAGEVCVGLEPDQLEHMGRTEGVRKASRRDIAAVMSRKLDAATTVAATMMLAERGEIPIFATGGIGGVHRGAESTFDVSADLQELARTRVAVVSAGPKALLDLRLTAEYLETLGVPVVGFGTDELPAFYSRESGLPVDYRMDSPEEIAHFLHTGWETDTLAGTVLANPVPREWSLPKEEMDGIIRRAVDEAEEQGLRGKELTPFLLARITELSEGKSLVSNIALVKNNADLAGRIAVRLNALRR